jgi:spermidine synthase
MLYSNSSFKHEKNKPQGMDSFLLGARIYNGNYWDEFGLTICSLNSPRILVLGAGHGACIRPMLAQNPRARIILVDNDQVALRSLSDLYRREFPQIEFDTQYADAITYQIDKAQFDAIWVDLYSNTGFISNSFSNDFIKYCEQGLSNEGRLYFNIFSAPCFYNFFKPDPRLLNLKSKFINIFSETYLFPHRRNFTLVGAKNNFKYKTYQKESLALSPTDLLMNRMHNLRWALAEPFLEKKNTSDNLKLEFGDVKKDFFELKKIQELFLLARDLAIASADVLNKTANYHLNHQHLIDRAMVVMEGNQKEFTLWVLPMLGSLFVSTEEANLILMEGLLKILNTLEEQYEV